MHPTLKIISLCFLAVTIQLVKPHQLFVVAGMLLVLIVFARATNFIKLALKVKWLVITMLCIYGINTPGEYVMGLSVDWAPTYEGLVIGALQSVKLLCMVAAVALLIKTTSTQSLLAGIYQCLQPLNFFKLAPERFAVRLWLTIDYVESHRIEFKRSNFLALLHAINDETHAQKSTPDTLVIVLPELVLLDYIILLCLIGALGLLCV